MKAAFKDSCQIWADRPMRHIHNFNGRVDFIINNEHRELNIENTMWMNTVLGSQTSVFAVVIYTGIETRAKLNSRR